MYDVDVIKIEELVKSLNSYQQGEIILGLVVLDYWCVASPIILGDPTTFVKNWLTKKLSQHLA